MNSFLRKCNSETLFLIDEFGTGSDPELGGALAEIFLEVFYERKSFGVITTHYSNLKLLQMNYLICQMLICSLMIKH
jgi:DNA mismatch repair protein MutS2